MQIFLLIFQQSCNFVSQHPTLSVKYQLLCSVETCLYFQCISLYSTVMCSLEARSAWCGGSAWFSLILWMWTTLPNVTCDINLFGNTEYFCWDVINNLKRIGDPVYSPLLSVWMASWLLRMESFSGYVWHE